MYILCKFGVIYLSIYMRIILLCGNFLAYFIGRKYIYNIITRRIFKVHERSERRTSRVHCTSGAPLAITLH